MFFCDHQNHIKNDIVMKNSLTDVDYAQFTLDRKSTFGMAHFVGLCLVFWGSKKQHTVALSTAKAEYVAAIACCTQLLWLQQ